jgi:hypothetical protein
MSEAQTQVKPATLKDAMELIAALTKRVEELESKTARPSNASQREMTDDDAKRILTGDLKDKKHNDAATALGLSYGQVYSCRGEYTFKHVHKALKAEGFKNPWIK